jgi:hypothetical protein
LPVAAMSSARDFILVKKSDMDMSPFLVVARVMRVVTARALVWEASIASIPPQTAAAVVLSATWVRISLETEASR